MKEVAIRAEGLGKQYHLGGPRERYLTLRDQLGKFGRVARRGFRRSSREIAPPFWALRDVSFEVRRGEVVGIIGRNGAGKSTLLKILSRITEPTEGEADIFGRVGSLLEVGTGFHPELTGRENVYLNGAILGMRRSEIVRQFDSIVEFAEVEKFIDTPVKHYSSGMYTRLAFAVAAHLEPEILVVDEVLAVGDAQFQKKCLGRMGDVARSGRTVLFVSHNLAAVTALCGRVICLEAGRVAFEGNTAAGVAAYLHNGSGDRGLTARTWPDDDTAPGCAQVRLLAARLVPDDDKPAARLSTADGFRLEFEYRVIDSGLRLNLALQLTNAEETLVLATPSQVGPDGGGGLFPPGVYRTACYFPAHLLNDGPHQATVMFVLDSSTVLERVDGAVRFDVHDSPDGRGDWFGKWAGAVRPQLPWHTERCDV